MMGLKFRDNRVPTLEEFTEAAQREGMRAVKLTPASSSVAAASSRISERSARTRYPARIVASSDSVKRSRYSLLPPG